jgi:eukaryotic-like serine/threonine-protein kinase
VTRRLQSLDQDHKALADAFCVERLFPVYFHRHSNLRGMFLGAKCWLETDNRSARLGMSQSGESPLDKHTLLGPLVRFGPFEVDIRTAELHYNGRKTLLHDQPFKVLQALLERPGELVSREELIGRIWPNGTFVDYERGLNKAINKLRDALRDTAESPRFIETIPRRGYRFIAPLEIVSNGLPIAVTSATDSAQTHAPRTTRASSERIAWFIAAALVVAVILVLIRWRNSKPPREALYFSAPLSFPAKDIAVAPNSHTIAIVGYLESARKNALWIYEVGSQEARTLAATEGASYPFWSPDGLTVAFFADGKLKKVPLSGGPVQTICDAPSGRGGTWNKDGVIVFTPDGRQGGGLYRVLAWGETAKPISNPDKASGEDSHRWPMFLPDGRHYIYMAANFSGRNEADSILVGSLDSNEKHLVVKSSANAAYATPGYLLFYRNNALLTQRFDLKHFVVTGEPKVMLTDVQYLSSVKRAVFAASNNGVLLAQTGNGAAISQPTWFDRNGRVVGSLGQPGVYANVSLAPTGKSVSVSLTDIASLNTDIWTYDLVHSSAKRLTFDVAVDRVPVWSPDATRLVFTSSRQSNIDLYMKNADGTEEEKSIVHDDFNKYPNDWSRDGKYILYTRGPDLWFVTVPDLKSGLYLRATSVLRNGQFSPDGKWVAYASNESGKWEIYVTSFPEPQGKWQVSTGGGEQPRWRGDGNELFYLSSDNKMMVAPVTTGAKFDSGTPVALFQANPREQVSLNDVFVYDVRRDGQEFLINTKVRQAETAPMSVVLNWDAKLNK